MKTRITIPMQVYLDLQAVGSAIRVPPEKLGNALITRHSYVLDANVLHVVRTGRTYNDLGWWRFKVTPAASKVLERITTTWPGISISQAASYIISENLLGIATNYKDYSDILALRMGTRYVCGVWNEVYERLVQERERLRDRGITINNKEIISKLVGDRSREAIYQFLTQETVAYRARTRGVPLTTVSIDTDLWALLYQIKAKANAPVSGLLSVLLLDAFEYGQVRLDIDPIPLSQAGPDGIDVEQLENWLTLRYAQGKGEVPKDGFIPQKQVDKSAASGGDQ